MRTELVIRDVRRTESLENYLTSQMEGIVEALIPNRRNAVMRLTVEEDAHRTQNRRPHFECSVYFKVGTGRPIRIKKQDADFHSCVESLAVTFREALRRNHQKAALLSRHSRHEKFTPRFEYDEEENSIGA